MGNSGAGMATAAGAAGVEAWRDGGSVKDSAAGLAAKAEAGEAAPGCRRDAMDVERPGAVPAGEPPPLGLSNAALIASWNDSST